MDRRDKEKTLIKLWDLHTTQVSLQTLFQEHKDYCVLFVYARSELSFLQRRRRTSQRLIISLSISESIFCDLPGYNLVQDPDADAVKIRWPHPFKKDGYGEPGYLDDASAGGYFLQDNQENYFGFTKGLSDNTANPSPVKWNQVIATSQLGMPAERGRLLLALVQAIH